jgi:hypothetical protein
MKLAFQQCILKRHDEIALTLELDPDIFEVEKQIAPMLYVVGWK